MFKKISKDRGSEAVKHYLLKQGIDWQQLNIRKFIDEMAKLHEKRIPLEQCRDRVLYRLHSRNLSFGVFDTERKGFMGLREKFENVFPFMEYHYDAPSFATASPLEELPEELPQHILLAEYMPGTACKNCEGSLEFKPDNGDAKRVDGPGVWYHLGAGNCTNPSPITICNNNLQNWLEEMENKYGSKD